MTDTLSSILGSLFAIAIFAFEFYMLFWAVRWCRNRLRRPRLTLQAPRTPEIPVFVERPSPRPVLQTPFNQAELLQFQRDGHTVWQPTSTVSLVEDAPLDEAWISTILEAPTLTRQGGTIVLRVQVSNNHPSTPLRDEGMLEVEYPSSAVQVLGSEAIKLDTEGDTSLIYFPWTAPHVPGNYVLRFTLLNHQAKTERVLIVQ